MEYGRKNEKKCFHSQPAFDIVKPQGTEENPKSRSESESGYIAQNNRVVQCLHNKYLHSRRNPQELSQKRWLLFYTQKVEGGEKKMTAIAITAIICFTLIAIEIISKGGKNK